MSELHVPGIFHMSVPCWAASPTPPQMAVVYGTCVPLLEVSRKPMQTKLPCTAVQATVAGAQGESGPQWSGEHHLATAG